jgi:D-glycero-D-manno-heptose 1,7-bisphosphate phosphatase
MPIKTIFLDRDGVINKEVQYLHKIENFEFIDGIFDACLHFQKLGYKIIIVSNQSGIARGYYTEIDYQVLTKWMLCEFKNQGITILDALHCPHDPDSRCNCRKPMPGMLLKSKNNFNINMDLSWMIGDKEIDIIAANAAGIKKSILVRSGHRIDEPKSNAMFVLDSIKESTKIIT